MPAPVLILSYSYWPALNARAFRWSALAEHWAEQNREVHVVCARRADRPASETIGGVHIHRVGSVLLERLRAGASSATGASTAQRSIRAALRRAAAAPARALWHSVYWPDTSGPWFFAARRKARELLATVRPEAVVSVSPTFTAVAVGRALAGGGGRAFRWLIDLGDPFSFAEEAPPNNLRLYRALNARFERRCFALADAVAVTTEATRSRYAQLFPESGGKIEVIPPLVSLPEAGASPRAPSGRRRLVFLGRLYPTIRRPDYLLALFAALAAEPAAEALELHFYGESWECEASFARYRDLVGRKIFLHGPVPRERATEAMWHADVLVNIGNQTRYQLPSKVVEYAATGRPILNLASVADDSSTAFLADYPAALTLVGREAHAAPEEIARLRDFLARAPDRVPPAALRERLAAHQLPAISARYLRLLDHSAARPGSARE